MNSSNEHGMPNLVLTGFMGTGKSTVGPLLAKQLGWLFIDTDALVEREAGMPVSEIFATHGEPAFRAMERRTCRDAATSHQAVISVGGGAVLDQENRRVLEQSGLIVLLTCEKDMLVRRLQQSARRGERPLLARG